MACSISPCPGAAAGAGGTAVGMGRAEVDGKRGHSCSPRAAVPGGGSLSRSSLLCPPHLPWSSRRNVSMFHPKPQHQHPSSSASQAHRNSMAGQEQQLWSWLPKGSSSPQYSRAWSHLQVSKEAPTAHPGLSVLPWEERGSDALAPCRQQETDVCVTQLLAQPESCSPGQNSAHCFAARPLAGTSFIRSCCQNPHPIEHPQLFCSSVSPPPC